MFETIFYTETPSTNIEVKVKYNISPSDELVRYEDKETFQNLCEKGCPTYNKKWACPPFSPSYSKYSKNYTSALIICFYIGLGQFGYIKNDYLKVKAANSILKSRMDKFLRSLEGQYGGKLLSNGSCRLCKPCSCKDKNSGCKEPDKMRYSMEALGLNVGEISKNVLNHELFWYRKNQLPLYTSVVSCLLNNSGNLNLQTIEETLTTSFAKNHCQYYS